MSEVATLLKSLGDEVKTIKTEIGDLKKKASGQGSIVKRINDPLSSRGYSFLKAIGLATGVLQPADAKVEDEMHQRIQKSMKAQGIEPVNPNSFRMPFASSFMGDDVIGREVRDLVVAGQAGDPEEIKHLRKSIYKDMSWNIDTSGGTLVPAPAQGELIDLLRNKTALIEAGARTVPMPPQGSVSFPKQTSASTATWIGENTTIPTSQPGTGDLLLRAKKLAGFVTIPNELFRYSSPAADAMVREDLARVLQIAMDLAGLTGVGSAVSPKGIVNYSINSYTARKTGTNGDAFAPDDFFGMMGKVAAVNGIVNDSSFAYIIRPELYFNVVGKRADAVSAGDAQGSFIQWSFNPNGEIEYRFCGKKIVPSNQIAADQTKGSSSGTLTQVIAGDFSQWIIAMAAALEIDQNRYSDTAFTKDQTQVRAILQTDMGPRHQESFVKCGSLSVTGLPL